MPLSRTDPAEHATEIAWRRRAKDEDLRSDPHSPIPPGDRRRFETLDYYPPDARWAVVGTIARIPDPQVLAIATSAGEPRAQVRYARIALSTPNGVGTLFAYKDEGAPRGGSLFVPFRDATSGKETYGAGRYLDLEEPHGDEVLVDFNMAYNPFCAYSEAYSCPLPPAENWLTIAVTAGERAYFVK